MRYKVNKDLNHDPIYKRLKEIPGIEVEDTSRYGEGFPDLMVGGIRDGIPVFLLVELKSKRGKLKKNQQTFQERWSRYTNVIKANRVSDILINGLGWEKEQAESLDTPEMEA